MGMFCYQCQEAARGTGCNVVNVLVNTFGIAGIGTVDDDISMFMGA